MDSETIKRADGTTVRVTREEARHFKEVFDPEYPIEHADSLGVVNCHNCWRPLLGEKSQAKRAAGLVLFETRIQAVEGRVMDHSSGHAVPFCRECFRRVKLSWRPAYRSVGVGRL